MSEDEKRELEQVAEEPGAADGTDALHRGSKLSSDAVVVLSTGAVLFTTILAGFIGLFVMISNLHETREERLEVVREIVRDDVGTLDSRIRAIEIGHASLEGQMEAATDQRRAHNG